MKYLNVYAGKTAQKVIAKEGFEQSLFSSMLGASGGPKWFCLLGLDKYLMGDFFAARNTPLHMIGSSAGAYRFAAMAQKDPVTAIEQFALSYAATRYSKQKAREEISSKAYSVIDEMLANQGLEEILSNPIFKVHFIVAQGFGGVSSASKAKQVSALAKTFCLNRVNRSHLAKQYQRGIFSSTDAPLDIRDPYAIPTFHSQLTAENLKYAIYASGAIPLAMDTVEASQMRIKSFESAQLNSAQVLRGQNETANSVYIDGGLIDYHFDFMVNHNDTDSPLVLYPHFSNQPKAGWFDKNSKRKPLSASYDNVVMLAPSQAFVDLLPHQKIPDRNDFKRFSDDERIQYWSKVLELSEYLAHDFHEMVSKQQLSAIQDVNFCQ